MGPSGAGKTTLIKILTGQLIPDKGSAEIMKHDTVSLSGRDKKEIGIMMDQFGVYERLSCTDNLRIYACTMITLFFFHANFSPLRDVLLF